MNLNNRLARLEARQKRTAGIGWWNRLYEAPTELDNRTLAEFIAEHLLILEKLDGAPLDAAENSERRAAAIRAYASRNLSTFEKIKAVIASPSSLES